MPRITTQLDLTYSAGTPDVLVGMTLDQATRLAELLKRHIDLDVVALDNDDPEGAEFVELLTAGLAQAVAR